MPEDESTTKQPLGMAEAGRPWVGPAESLFKTAIAHDIVDALATAEAVRHGVPFDVVASLAKDGAFDRAALDEAGVLSAADWRKAEKSGRFGPGVTQRVTRALRLTAEARDVFGEAKAAAWLSRPTKPLGGRSPLALLDTDEGARAAETLLGRIAHGIAA